MTLALALHMEFGVSGCSTAWQEQEILHTPNSSRNFID